MRATKASDLAQGRLKDVLDYDPLTGLFTWRHTRAKKVKGAVAGRVETDGYWRITVDYVHRQAHRLAFLWMTGSIPEFIDHIDGDRSNNRWSNLRQATHAQNMANSKKRSGCASALKGVSVDRGRSNPYRAAIKIDGKKVFLGRYATEEEAHSAYMNAAEKLYGEFARAA